MRCIIWIIHNLSCTQNGLFEWHMVGAPKRFECEMDSFGTRERMCDIIISHWFEHSLDFRERAKFYVFYPEGEKGVGMTEISGEEIWHHYHFMHSAKDLNLAF